MQPEQQQRIMGYFIEEAKDHLNTIEQGLLSLQSTIEDPEMVNELFRAAHSVKGGAAMLGLNSIQHVSHRMEDYFKILKESPVAIDQKLESLFLKVFDALQELLEQLQGPFGLTSDSANATLAGVEPTFVELEQHLNSLVGSAPVPVAPAAGNGFAAQPAIAQTSEQEILTQVFGSEVPTQLREMLQLFKQPESDSLSREQLQTICHNLASLGERFNLTNWCNLVELARQAIAQTETPYRTLAPIVIKDIKQAQDLVLAGRADAIAACAQLQELVPAQSTDADFADLLATADDIDLMAEPLEATDDDLLFAGLESSPVADELSTAGAGMSSLDFDLSDSFAEDTIDAFEQRHGPEVGMAELNSLADLFEGEVPDLASTWQEEEIIGDATDVFAADVGTSTDDFDTAADFSDLLFDEATSSQPVSSDEDDLSNLFGDALLDDDSGSPTNEDNLLGMAEDGGDSDDLDDLLAITTDDSTTDALFDQEIGLGEIESGSAANNLVFAEDYPSFDTAMTDEESMDMLDLGLETTSPLDNLGELFAGMDDTDLSLTDTANSFEDSLFASESDQLPEELDNSITSDGIDDLSFGTTAPAIGDPWQSDDLPPAVGEPAETNIADDLSDFLPSDFLQTDLNETSDLESLLTDDLSESEVATDSHLDDLFEQDNVFGAQSGFGQSSGANESEILTDQGDLDFGSIFDSPENADELIDASASASDFELEELTATTATDDESWLTDSLSTETVATQADDNLFDLDASLETPSESLVFDDWSEVESAPDNLFDSGDLGLEAAPLTDTLAADDLDLLLANEGTTETVGESEDLGFAGADLFEAPLETTADSNEFGLDLGELDLDTAADATTDEFGLSPDTADLAGAIAATEFPPDGTDLLDFTLSEADGGQSHDDLFGDDLAVIMGTESTTNDVADAALDFELADNVLPDDLSTTDGIFSEDLLDSNELVELDVIADTDLADVTGIADTTDELLDFDNMSGDDLSDVTTDSLDLGDDLFPMDNVNSSIGASETETPLALDDDLLDLGDFADESASLVNDDTEGLLAGSDELFGFDDLNVTDAAATSEFGLGDLITDSPDDLSDSDGASLSFDDFELTDLADEVDSNVNFDGSPLDETTLNLGDDSLGDLLDMEPASTTDEFDNLEGFWATNSEIAMSTEAGSELDALMDDSSSPPAANDLLDLESLMLDDSASSATDELAGLDDFLGEEANATNDFGDLENLLSESSPSVSNDFADLDNLLNDSGDTTDAFADLENLLDNTATNDLPLAATAGASATDDFSDLEALLQPDEAVPPTATVDRDTSFDDLNEMLKAAQDGPGSPASTSMRRSAPLQSRPSRKPGFEQTMRVPVKHLDNLSNLVGELVVNRNSLEQDQERLRQSLDNLLYQVQQLSDVGQRMQDLYERSLLESSLLASRQSHHRHHAPVHAKGDGSTQTASSPTGVEYDPLEMDRFTGFHSLSQEMIELIVRVRESASDIEFIVDETDQVTRMFRQVTTQLQEGLTRSRMVPFAQTADRLPRAVRDIAIKVGKQAELVIEGRETLIDKMILEQLYDPMTHLVNNAITHGIESPEVRRSLGKAPTGRIVIRAFHQGNQTIISVSDDGAGIDVERVKTKAIEKGLITPSEARSMSRLDMYDLLFHPGFSTKDQADDFSGRGVGMDVVRTSLSEIRGVINTDSTQGKGTSFTIRLPLTLSISKALCCISDRARIAFPMDGVEDMLDVPKDRIQTNPEGQPCLPWRDSLLPLRPLSELLGYNRHLSRGTVYGGNQEDDIASIVVLRSAGNFLALQVDQVLGEQEIVIKQLEGPVPKPIGVAGATVLGDGRIMPIADVLELIDLAMGRIRKDTGGSLWDQGATATPQEPAVIKTEPMVLIVDDSITVRELLSMTFNKVGYRVEQARDGQEAWEKLRSGLPCDIVFCDIEMPRMDGLELLSRIQKDPNLTSLPIAMLTSRGADRHRQMASSLGASGYFTKPYLEEALLDAAQRMLKGEKLL